MAKRNDLRQKLKASNRRRQRRLESAQPLPSTATKEPSVDVYALVVDAILADAASQRDPRDIRAVSALRAYVNGTASADSPTAELNDRLHQIEARQDVSKRSLRTAMERMLELAHQHHDLQRPNAFLSYLELLSDG